MRTDGTGYRHEELTGVDFSGRSFGTFLAHGGAFVRCSFDGAAFEQFTVGHEAQTTFTGCTFTRTRFPLHNTYLGDVRFEGCVFDGARLRELRLDTVEFVGCTFKGRIWHTVFSGVPMPGRTVARPRNAWHGNDFSAADLVDVGFRDIDLLAQRWPADRHEYALVDRVDERVAATSAAIGAHPGAARMRPALMVLHRQTPRDPNGFVLLRRQELGHMLPPVLRDLLWSHLVEAYSDDQA